MKKIPLILIFVLSLLNAQNKTVQKGGKSVINSPIPSKEEWVAIQLKNLQSIKDIPAEDIPGFVAAKESEYDFLYKGGIGSQTDPYAPLNYFGFKPGIGNNNTQSAGCPNAAFDFLNFTNWTGGWGNSATCGPASANSPIYNQTNNTIQTNGINAGLTNQAYHTIMNIPPTNPVWPNCTAGGYDSIGCITVGTQTVSQIPVTCPFFNTGTSCRMNGYLASARACSLRYTFNITPTVKNVKYAFAVILNSGGHAPPQQPFFRVRVTDQNNNPIGGVCGIYDINATSAATDTSFFQSVFDWGQTWCRKWRMYGIDLTNNPGITQVNVNFIVGGCCYYGHYAYAYVAAECSAGGVINSMCAGTNTAQIVAPPGYVNYQWFGPNIVGASNTQSINVNPAIVGSVYTLNLVTPTGCTTTLTHTLNISQPTITGVGTLPTCIGGSSGSATVFVAGSNNGYTYTWTAPGNSVVSSNSTAVNLAPGIYTIQVAGVSCGTPVATTVQVIAIPPIPKYVTKPYCGNIAIITASAGTNYQWYNGTTPIPPPSGTQNSLVINNPINNSIYWVSYMTPQGCKDSVRYTLQSMTPGNVGAYSISPICTGATNGTAAIVFVPANGSPPNQNTVGVIGPNNYSFVAGPTGNTININNLGAGIYTINGFDGSCFYTQQFTVTPFTFNYTLTPQTPTICQGNTFTASINMNLITGTPCSTTGVGPACSNPNLHVLGTQNGQNTQWTYPAPYGNWYRNARHQFIVRATELQAMGMGQGYITSLGFNVINVFGTNNYPGYTIRIKCTAANAVGNTFDNTGLIQVFQANVTPVVGWNQHNFTTPFLWDGTSNLLIDICYNMTANWTQNCVSPWQTTPFNSTLYFYSDFSTACMTTLNPSNAFGVKTQRPLMRFGYCPGYNANSFNFQWLPNNTSIFSAPTATTTSVSPLPITGYSAQVIYTTVVTPTFINCPVAQQMTVTIYNPTQPTISAIPNMCNTFPPYNVVVTPTGGAFSGNNAVSAGGILTPSMATIGNNTVMYSIGVGSCVLTTTASFEVSQFNTAALNGSVAPMCHTFTPVNLMGLVQSTINGTWSGTAVNSNSFNPLNLPTGIYTLTYNTTSSPNPTVCPHSSTLAIDVLNPPTPTIVSAGPFCTNFVPQQLQVIPNTGTWTPHMALNANNGIFTPSLANVGSNILYYSTGTFTCMQTSSLNIMVEQFVPAVITGSIPDKCVNHSVVYLGPIATNQLGTWSGPGVVNGNIFDPAQSGTGVITLTYQTHSVPTTTLCPDMATLSVNVFSLATPVINPEGPFCNTHQPKQLQVAPVGGMFYGPGVSAQGLFAPSFAQIGANVINYSISAGPCIEVATTTINVEKFIHANFMQYPGPFCKNDMPVNLQSYVINPGGYFTGGAGLNGSVFTPSLANIGNNNIVIYHTHSSPTASLCPDSAAVRITVNDNPNPVVVANKDKGCAPLELILSCSNYNTGSGTWYLGNGTDPISGLNVTYTFTEPGNYNLTFEYMDDIGCNAIVTLPTTITVYDVPKADFYWEPYGEISLLAPEIHLINQSQILGHNNYLWNIGNLYSLTEVNPKVVFPEAGEYYIKLTATNVHGCKDEISKLIVVKNDYGIFIPNSFTPNYDGINDDFRVYYTPFGLDPSTFELEIFDRWGISLFKTKDINQGWDGTKGGKGDEPVKEGVYVYKVKYKDKEGKIHHKTGHVTLLK